MKRKTWTRGKINEMSKSVGKRALDILKNDKWISSKEEVVSRLSEEFGLTRGRIRSLLKESIYDSMIAEELEERTRNKSAPGIKKIAERIVVSSPWKFKDIKEIAEEIEREKYYPELHPSMILRMIKTHKPLLHYVKVASIGEEKVLEDALKAVETNEAINNIKRLADHLVNYHKDYSGIDSKILELMLRKHKNVEKVMEAFKGKERRWYIDNEVEDLLNDIIKAEEKIQWDKKTEIPFDLSEHFGSIPNIAMEALIRYLRRLDEKKWSMDEKRARLVQLGIPPDMEDLILEMHVEDLTELMKGWKARTKKKGKNR